MAAARSCGILCTPGDDAIDASELKLLCAEFGRELSDADLARAMQKLDVDGSGRVHFDEFVEWWELGMSISALVNDERSLRDIGSDHQRQRAELSAAADVEEMGLQVRLHGLGTADAPPSQRGGFAPKSPWMRRQYLGSSCPALPLPLPLRNAAAATAVAFAGGGSYVQLICSAAARCAEQNMQLLEIRSPAKRAAWQALHPGASHQVCTHARSQTLVSQPRS